MERMVDRILSCMREACCRNFKSQSKGRRSVWRKSERLLNYRSVSVQTALSNVANWSNLLRCAGLVAWGQPLRIRTS
jgi:hypothetical protein